MAEVCAKLSAFTIFSIKLVGARIRIFGESLRLFLRAVPYFVGTYSAIYEIDRTPPFSTIVYVRSAHFLAVRALKFGSKIAAGLSGQLPDK